MQRRNLLDHQLWIFNAPEFIHVQLVRHLHYAAVNRSRLIEGYGIDDTAAVGWTHSQLQVVFSHRTLFDD